MVETIKINNEKYFPKSFENRFDSIFKRIDSSHRISFDADGVLIDSATPVVKEFNKNFGTSFAVKDIDGWDSVKDWAILKGVAKNDAEKFNYNIWTNPNLLEQAKPLPGSLEIYRKLLNKSRYPIPIITVRNHHLREVTFDWFKRYLPEVPKKWIIMREDAEISGNTFKIDKIKELKIDWHFDDSFEVMSLITEKLADTNVCFISNNILEKPNGKRIVVIPSWEWSPELY